MTLKDKLMVYIYNKGNELDEELEIQSLQSKHTDLDSLDHFELMCAKIRVKAFKEFIDDIFRIIINCK